MELPVNPVVLVVKHALQQPFVQLVQQVQLKMLMEHAPVKLEHCLSHSQQAFIVNLAHQTVQVVQEMPITVLIANLDLTL